MSRVISNDYLKKHLLNCKKRKNHGKVGFGFGFVIESELAFLCCLIKSLNRGKVERAFRFGHKRKTIFQINTEWKGV